MYCLRINQDKIPFFKNKFISALINHQLALKYKDKFIVVMPVETGIVDGCCK